MNIEQIAREAGMELDDELEPQPVWYVDKGNLERFAALIRAAVVEELLAGVGEPDIVYDCERWYTADQMAAAVAIERERFLDLVDAFAHNNTDLAAAIRSGDVPHT